MIEFISVDHGTVYPNGCVVCGAIKGPLIDTHVEKWGEHLYLCRLCVTRAARVYGLVKGPQMEELLNAADVVAEKDRQLEQAAKELSELRLDNGSQRATVKDLRSQLQDERGRMKTVAHLTTEVERLSHELVEAAAGVVPDVSVAA